MTSHNPSLKKLGMASRRAITCDQDSLVKTRLTHPDQALPLIIEPAVQGVDLVDWSRQHQTAIETWLRRYGALLFRGFDVADAQTFQEFTAATCGSPLEYRERSSPRSQVTGNIYTSTDYPADQHIFLHNEHSYSATFPLRILFYCAIPAETGGATPIADCRRVLARIDPAIVERFQQSGWMYVRNFGAGFGLPWQTVFQTDDPTVVETYCRQANIQWEWKAGNRLRTYQVRPVLATHPRTGERIWFNHMTFFHISTLPPAIRDALLAQFADDLPNNTYYGDSSPIEPEVLDHLRAAYFEEQVAFAWQQHDVLLLDNMLVAHGRESFTGSRKILVAMAQPYTRTDLSPPNSGT